MNATDHTLTTATRALAAAGRLRLRFFDRDSHAALQILTEIRRLACILSRGPDPRAVRRAEGKIYTRIQAARDAGCRLSAKSRLRQAEAVFQHAKPLAEAILALPPSRAACRGRLETLIAGAGELLLLLELQIAALSAAAAYRHASDFSVLASALRGELAKCRIRVLTETPAEKRGPELTLLQAAADLLDAAEAMACSAVRRRLRRRGGKGGVK